MDRCPMADEMVAKFKRTTLQNVHFARGGGDDYDEDDTGHYTFAVTLSIETVEDTKDTIFLDTAASKGIFGNASLLRNVAPAPPVTFHGICGSGPPVNANLAGQFGDFGKIMLGEKARTNILSMSEQKSRGFSFSYDDDEDTFYGKSPTGGVHRFIPHKGKYALAREPPCIQPTLHNSPMAMLEKRVEFPTRELAKVDPVTEFQDMTASPSVESTIEIVRPDSLPGNPVPIKETERIKDETTAPSQSAPLLRTGFPPGGRDQEAHCDFLFLDPQDLFEEDTISDSEDLSRLGHTGLENPTDGATDPTPALKPLPSPGSAVGQNDSQSSFSSSRTRLKQNGDIIMDAPVGLASDTTMTRVVIKDSLQSLLTTTSGLDAKTTLFIPLKALFYRSRVYYPIGSDQLKIERAISYQALLQRNPGAGMPNPTNERQSSNPWSGSGESQRLGGCVGYSPVYHFLIYFDISLSH